jgi:hypothetical protein
MDKQLHNDINRILDQIGVPTEQTPDYPSEETLPSPEKAETIVHVYLMNEQPAKEPMEAPSPQAEDQTSALTPSPTLRTWFLSNKRLSLLVVFCVFSLVAIAVWYLYPLLTASATITIIPVSKQISTMNTVIVVTAQTSTGAQQIPGSILSSVTMSQAKTVVTTGRGHQDAQAAHGLVTFYNAATSGQTITASTLLTGADGVQVITDQDAFVPPAQYPTFGQATISAHAVITGPAGNIRAADIYGPCCRLNISAVNSTFDGGQQARDFQTVTQTDINNAASSLKSSLDQSVQAALKTQVAADQTLITPLSCQQGITPNYRAGAEATQVHVTVSETCIGATYNTESLQRLAAQQIKQQASKQLGKGYLQTGTIESRIIEATPKEHGAITLQVKSTANYTYQFTQEQQRNVKEMIAGKTKAQATSILLQVSGVQSVSLSLSYGEQLPTDPNRIHLAFLITS